MEDHAAGAVDHDRRLRESGVGFGRLGGETDLVAACGRPHRGGEGQRVARADVVPLRTGPVTLGSALGHQVDIAVRIRGAGPGHLETDACIDRFRSGNGDFHGGDADGDPAESGVGVRLLGGVPYLVLSGGVGSVERDGIARGGIGVFSPVSLGSSRRNDRYVVSDVVGSDPSHLEPAAARDGGRSLQLDTGRLSPASRKDENECGCGNNRVSHRSLLMFPDPSMSGYHMPHAWLYGNISSTAPVSGRVVESRGIGSMNRFRPSAQSGGHLRMQN
ncbi:MAG: hypothetical protein BWX47_01892 [candidate division Hyd24-12 bacterium ADurb.Bin004]|nr:MAG: hypothetical protein BWX47_01892 [candidate division Hyd24-12 bacterium ADurb.Bin004]